AGGRTTPLALSLSSGEPVEGLVAAVEWDASRAHVDALAPAAILEQADVVATRVGAGFAVLAVIFDEDGIGAATLPPGEGLVLAELEVRPVGGVGGVEVEEIAISFAHDGAGHAVIDGGPLLDNHVAIGGRAIDRRSGLQLVDGLVIALPAPSLRFRLGEPLRDGATGRVIVDVLLDHPEDDVQAFEISLAHDQGVSLVRATIE